MKIFTPFANRVLVEIEKEEVSSQIVIPAEYERSLEKAIGQVVEVGPDCQSATIGMRVLLSKYAGIEVQIMDVSYRVMHEDDIAGEFHEQMESATVQTEQRLG